MDTAGETGASRARGADSIRVIVVDDEEPLRDAVAELISSESGLEAVGRAGTATDAIELAATLRPHVALVDVRMPGGGPAAARGIRAVSPGTAVLALSAYEDHATVLEMLGAGAVGYLVKGIQPVEILEAVARAARGQASLSIEVIGRLIAELTEELDERRRAVESVRRSEERFRNLVESAPDAVVIVDARGDIVLVNEQTEALFGYPRDELLGKSVELLLPDRFRGQHALHRTAYLEDPRTRPMGVGLELAGRRRDGTEFPVDISLAGVETPEGLLATARIRDITEQRRAEEVRRRGEGRFAALLESAPDAVVIVDEDGRMVIVNEQTERLFGYTREELVGQPVELLLPERFQDRHVAHRGDYYGDPGTRPMGAGLELFGRRRDGTEFPVDISLSAVETDEGRLATAFIRDATDRRAAEELRRKGEDRFRALLESAPDGVLIADAEGRIVLANHQIEELFGYERQELLGKPVELLLPARFHERHRGHRAEYLDAPSTRPMGVGLDLAGRRKDQSEFPVDISLSTIETDEGRLLTAFVRDITGRRAQADLERDLANRRALLAHLVTASEEERSRIAADIHDDSIQAITAAGMRLQILRRGLQDPDQLRLLDELEETVRLSIGRLRHLLFELRPPVLDNEGLSAALQMYLR